MWRVDLSPIVGAGLDAAGFNFNTTTPAEPCSGFDAELVSPIISENSVGSIISEPTTRQVRMFIRRKHAGDAVRCVVDILIPRCHGFRDRLIVSTW